MNTNKTERIALRAYQIWEAEGRPEHRADEHWRRAEQEVAREEGAEQMGASSEDSPAQERDTRPAPAMKAAPPLAGADVADAATPPGEAGPKRTRRKSPSRRPRKPPQQG